MVRAMKVLLLVAVLAVVPGCNIIGFLASAAAPPELVEAKYKMPNKPTLIIVDDWNGLVNDEAMMRRIALGAQSALTGERVVTKGFVGQDELSAYREELGTAYRNTSIGKLGMHLNAKQVVYARVTGYQMSLAGSVIKPSITLEIKVIDLDKRKRVFPDPSAENKSPDTQEVYTLQVTLATRDMAGQSASRSIAARELADVAGRDLGRLFFDWRKPKPGTTIEENR